MLTSRFSEIAIAFFTWPFFKKDSKSILSVTKSFIIAPSREITYPFNESSFAISVVAECSLPVAKDIITFSSHQFFYKLLALKT